MKYNKAIWATALTGASSLITFLTWVQPELPAAIGAPLAAVLAVATPVVVYLVPNIDRIVDDVTDLVDDIHDHDTVQAAVHGAIVGKEAQDILNAARGRHAKPEG